MIFNSIVYFLTSVADFIIGLLPNANSSITTSISSSTTGFRTALAAANWIFPVDTALGFLAAVLIIEGSIFGWKIFRWIASILSANLLH